MHELSIAQSIVDLASEQARSAKAHRVVSIRLSLGLLSGVVREALEFCFPVACEGTLCDGAQLEISMEPAKAHCPFCGEDVKLDEFLLVCPICGKYPIELVSGGDLQLVSLEVE